MNEILSCSCIPDFESCSIFSNFLFGWRFKSILRAKSTWSKGKRSRLSSCIVMNQWPGQPESFDIAPHTFFTIRKVQFTRIKGLNDNANSKTIFLSYGIPAKDHIFVKESYLERSFSRSFCINALVLVSCKLFD